MESHTRTYLLVALAVCWTTAGFSQQIGRPSRLIDTSVWQLRSPNLVGRFQRMREAITAEPSEAKRRWSRMMRARRSPDQGLVQGRGKNTAQFFEQPRGQRGSRNRPRRGSAPVFPSRGDGPGGLGQTRLADPVAESGLLQPVLEHALGRISKRLAGDTSFGAIKRQSGGGSQTRLRRGGKPLGGAAGNPAGPAVRMQTKYRDLGRWERAKAVLLSVGTAYVQQDIQEFMRQFSTNAALDLSVLRNAVQEDFEQEADVHLDFELIEYRASFDTFHVRLRWLRTAVLEDGTPTRTDLGESQILLDRHDGFRIKSWVGLPPFGRRDPELIKQTRAGNPNDLDNDNSNDDSFGQPDEVATPTTQVLPSDIIVVPQLDTSSVMITCLDLSNPNPVFQSCGGPDDLFFDFLSAPTVFTDGSTDFFIDCGAPAPLENYGAITDGGLSSLPVNDGVRILGIDVNPSGLQVLAELNYNMGANTLDVRLRRSTTGTFPSAVGQGCP